MITKESEPMQARDIDPVMISYNLKDKDDSVILKLSSSVQKDGLKEIWICCMYSNRNYRYRASVRMNDMDNQAIQCNLVSKTLAVLAHCKVSTKVMKEINEDLPLRANKFLHNDIINEW